MQARAMRLTSRSGEVARAPLGGSECAGDVRAWLETEIDSDHNLHRRGDASCSSLLQQTKPLRKQSEQRFGTKLGNLNDSGL